MLQSVIKPTVEVLAMPKRKRLFVLLAMPIAVFLWCIGWSFYVVGAKRKKLKPTSVIKTEKVIFNVLLPEEKIEA